MSKLQKKAVKIIIIVNMLIFLIGLVLSYRIVFLPLKKQAIDSLMVQHSYTIEESDSVLTIVKEYANYVAYSNSILNNLKEYISDTRSMKKKHELASSLYYLTHMKTGVRSIALDSENEPIVYSLLGPSKEEKKLFETDWYHNLHNEEYGNRFSKGITVKDEEAGTTTKVVAYIKNYNISNLKFTLTIFFDYSEIFGNITRYRNKEFTENIWLDEFGDVLFDEQKESDFYKSIQDNLRKSETYVQKSSGIYLIKQLNEGPYISVVFMSNEQLYKEFSGYLVAITIILIIVLIVSLTIILMIIGRITGPIYKLSKAMKYAVNNDLNIRTEINSDDEIGDLSHTFNRMIDDIKSYVEDIVQKEEKEQEMKFGLLISQIDPHFICNTLNTVNYLARQSRNEDVVIVSTALSNLLRDRLRIKNFQIYDTVLQEVETVKQYLTIQKYRYGREVKVDYDIKEDTLMEMLPKNIIQPLVENALFHGLSDEDTGIISGTINVKIAKADNGLVLEIKDDGRGIPQEKIEQILDYESDLNKQNRNHGIGIAGVIERLKILYQKNYEFKIHSSIGEGTTIFIKIFKNIK